MKSADLNVLVTGGAGFIGSNFIHHWIGQGGSVVNLDKLTYAGNLHNLRDLVDNPGYEFVRGDINDRPLVRSLLQKHLPRAIVHFAAESHVDRSILGPEEFIRTNVQGTFSLLDETRLYTQSHPNAPFLKFIHVSTDEVYGSLSSTAPPFSETSPYRPNSPYSASKAASDHLARAYFTTYALPTIVTNCSNNYGPYQFPEKLIPLVIANALSGCSLPVYGDGLNIRDWIYVEDHCRALTAILHRGWPGETYNIGAKTERTNLDLVTWLCGILDELVPDRRGPYSRLITHVQDRPGHDRRYAVDSSKLTRELGWTPAETLQSGLRKTVQWYLDNSEWMQLTKSGEYRDWIDSNYTHRAAHLVR